MRGAERESWMEREGNFKKMVQGIKPYLRCDDWKAGAASIGVEAVLCEPTAGVRFCVQM